MFNNTLGLYDIVNQKEIGKIDANRKVLGGKANFTQLNTFKVVGDNLFVVSPGGLGCLEWKKLEPKWTIDNVDNVQANYYFFEDPADKSWFIIAVNTTNKDKMKTYIYHVSNTGKSTGPNRPNSTGNC
ncbi:MAG: hypothetical protein ACP5O2_08215 [Bacteroidales bacterium]